MARNEKILITGSSGHAGSEIAKLLGSNYETIGVDLHEGHHTDIVGDLNDNNIHEITKEVDFVIHTASLHAPHVTTHSRTEFIETNITGTLNLLEASKEGNVKKFIYTSTTSLYGESLSNPEQAVWVTEELPRIARDIYDITKIAAEDLCKDFFDLENLQTMVLRVSRFWEEPLDKKVFYRMYRGLDVRDVAKAHKLALETEINGFEAFNISSQTIFLQNELLDLKNQLGPLLQNKLPELVTLFEQKGWDLPTEIDRVYTIDKAKRILNYHPNYNIQEMIEELQSS